MFGDLDWPLNASRGFVSISWDCCLSHVSMQCMQIAILFYLFCPSDYLNKWTYRHTFWRSGRASFSAGCHGNLPVLNLLSASVAKNQHFHPCRKNYALDRKMRYTFYNCREVLYQHAKFGEIELRSLAVGAKIGVFCLSRLVCLCMGDIVQTSIMWRFVSILCGFSAFFRKDCSFRCTT